MRERERERERETHTAILKHTHAHLEKVKKKVSEEEDEDFSDCSLEIFIKRSAISLSRQTLLARVASKTFSCAVSLL